MLLLLFGGGEAGAVADYLGKVAWIDVSSSGPDVARIDVGD
jgi:hypothetical protein